PHAEAAGLFLVPARTDGVADQYESGGKTLQKSRKIRALHGSGSRNGKTQSCRDRPDQKKEARSGDAVSGSQKTRQTQNAGRSNQDDETADEEDLTYFWHKRVLCLNQSAVYLVFPHFIEYFFPPTFLK